MAYSETMKSIPGGYYTDDGGQKELSRSHFRLFLIRLLYYNRFYVAFGKLDDDENKTVDYHEWKVGAASLSKDLGVKVGGRMGSECPLMSG